MKIYVAHASQFDFKDKLYTPLRASALNTEHEILLPQDGPIEEITRDMINATDALVAEVSAPSLGVGIEIGWADAAGVPVIAMYEKDSHPSFSIDNAVSDRFEYESSDDMIAKLTAALQKLG
jgi:nucleoside 2-deoxyribosyltransferase